MHNYLRSIGFSQLNTKKQEEILIENVIKNPQTKKLITNPSDRDMMYAELSCEYAPGIGIRVFGQYDENEMFHLDHYFPYVEGRFESVNEECIISKKMDSAAYSGLCEDEHFGVSTIFYVVNAMDYLKNADKNIEDGKKSIAFSALCTEGTILLPTINTKNVMDGNEKTRKQVKMLCDAKNGDKEAIEQLTIEEIETYASLTKRSVSEDVFAIVETSLIPFGMESEVYKMLGIIMEVKVYENPVLHERMYLLKVNCNDVIFDVCVNEHDLQGEPERGRRFRGIIWLQGNVAV